MSYFSVVNKCALLNSGAPFPAEVEDEDLALKVFNLLLWPLIVTTPKPLET